MGSPPARSRRYWSRPDDPGESHPGVVLGEFPVEPIDNVEDGKGNQPGSGLGQAIEEVVHHRDPDSLAVIEQPGSDEPGEGHDHFGIHLDQVGVPGGDQ